MVQYSMLNQTTIEQIAENRRTDKPAIQTAVIYRNIDPRSYQNLVQWMMDDNFLVHFFYLIKVTQSAMALKINRNTRFLARVYFDQFLYNSKDIEVNHYIPFAVTSISLAIKFNELRKVQDTLTPQYLFGLAQIPYSSEYYYSLESQIIGALRFRFKFATPYDSIDIFCDRFPWSINHRAALSAILDLTIALPFCAEYTSEQIFYATVETIFQAKHILLTNTQKQVLSSMTDTWTRASQLSLLILSQIRDFFAI